jgi:uncharacterized NAD(P)/FAD-binding protein YdhS
VTRTQFDVAIVGAGFAGIACAISLTRRNSALNIVLLDPATTLPAGLAFAGARAEHLLNVRADQMSLDGTQPLDFCAYLAKHGLVKVGNDSSAAIGESFAPRALYCDYVREVFHQAQRDAAAGGGQILPVRMRVSEITRVDQGYLIFGAHGDSSGTGEVLQLHAPQVILALGAGEYKSFIKHPRWHLGPWRLTELPVHTPGDTALIIGSGLTGIDSAQTLHRLGWQGAIEMLSPNARLPAANLARALPTWQLAPNFVQLSQTPRLFLRALRAELARAKIDAVDWRAVLNALRAITAEIFVSWTPRQRTSILRRAGSIWGTHRHRMPPSVAALIYTLESNGKLTRLSGRFIDVSVCGETALQVRIATRANANAMRTNVYALVIDARGPNYRTSDWPLITKLIDADLLKASQTGFGLAVDRDGRVAEHIYTLGVLTYGERLETMAVPEIRLQAERIAELILVQIASRQASCETAA